MRLRRTANRAARRAQVSCRRRAARRQQPGPGPLGALTASALALPGLAGSAQAAEDGSRWSIEHVSSYYIEDELDEDDVQVGGETERYEIQAHHIRLQMPFTPRTDLQFDALYETMSGASPWFIQPDVNGDPVQVMSEASIEDTRIDLLGRSTYNLDNGTFSLLGGISTENDYFAGNGGVEMSIDFAENNASFASGASFSIDTIEPTESGQFATRVDEEEKQSYSAFVSLSQILSRSTILRGSLNGQFSTGFLSDPYKLVSVEGVNVADSRPDERYQGAAMIQLRQHIAPIDATLHADYTFAIDDWGIMAHTAELAWYQTLFGRVHLVPSIRYYTQSEADFYDLYFLTAPGDGYASSDYRLSGYGAISRKLRAEVDFETPWLREMAWKATATWERYLSEGDWALQGSDTANPGLVNFNVFRVNLVTRF